MFKPLSQLNYFFRLALERELSGSDQLLYLHILWKFNEAHWTETLRIRDAELKDLMNLRDTDGKPASIEVVRRGKQRLKAKGFIDFKSGKGNLPTEYRLIKFYPDDTPADSSADTPEDAGQRKSLLSIPSNRKDGRREENPPNPPCGGKAKKQSLASSKNIKVAQNPGVKEELETATPSPNSNVLETPGCGGKEKEKVSGEKEKEKSGTCESRRSLDVDAQSRVKKFLADLGSK